MLEIRICDGKELELSKGSHVYWNSGLGRDTYRKWCKMRNLRLVLFFIMGVATLLQPQPSGAVTWSRTYGDTADDFLGAIRQATDGSFIVAGNSANAEAGANWLLKLDGDGGIVWRKAYGEGRGRISAVQPTRDRAYIFAGESSPGTVWVVKLNGAGNIVWQNTYGEGSPVSILQSRDGGYLVTAHAPSFLGDTEVLLIKLNGSGGFVWGFTYGDNRDDFPATVAQTDDGGYVLSGFSASAADTTESWIMQLDPNGGLRWRKTYGGIVISSVAQARDGGYIAGGARGADACVFKLDDNGSIQWLKTYGGSATAAAAAVEPTLDGGYIVAAVTDAFGAGGADAWVLKLDGNGAIEWQKVYGGSAADEALAVQQTGDGGYLVAGVTTSFGAGGTDVWMMKLLPSGEIAGCPSAMAETTAAVVSSPSPTPATVRPTTVNAKSAQPLENNAAVGSPSLETAEICVLDPSWQNPLTPFFPLFSIILEPDLSAMAVPAGQEHYDYPPVKTPLTDPDPARSRPVAVGDVAGGTLSLQVALPGFRAAVDVYLALVPGPVAPGDIYLFALGDQLLRFDGNLVPWLVSTAGDLTYTFFEDLPLSALPAGTYDLVLVVTPTGTGNLDRFSAWSTYFTVP